MARALPQGAANMVEIGVLNRRLFSGDMFPISEKYRTRFGKGDVMERIDACIQQANMGLMLYITDFGRESLELDPHVLTCAQKRFGAIAELDWTLTPATGPDIDPKLATEMADVIRGHLQRMRGFKQALYDIAWGAYDGRSLEEIDWQFLGGRYPNVPVGIDWVHPRRLAFGPHRELCVIDTFRAGISWWSYNGVPVENLPGKFVRWLPRYFNDYAEREGLLRRSLYWQYFKRFNWRERMVFTELFGKPLRVVTWEKPEAGQPETSDITYKQAAGEAEQLGGTTTANMPAGSHLEVMWPGGENGPATLYSGGTAEVNKEMSRLWLGNEATTVMMPSGIGSGSAQVQAEEQNIFLERDSGGIAERIQEDLIRIDVILNWGPDLLSHAPHFHLRAKDEIDRSAEQLRLNSAITIGVPVKVSQYAERTGVEIPNEDEKIIIIGDAGKARIVDQKAEREAAARDGRDTSVDVGSIALTPTDMAAVVRVNEARAGQGLGPLMLPDGKPDPDGQLPVSAYRTKMDAQFQAPKNGPPGAPSDDKGEDQGGAPPKGFPPPHGQGGAAPGLGAPKPPPALPPAARLEAGHALTPEQRLAAFARGMHGLLLGLFPEAQADSLPDPAPSSNPGSAAAGATGATPDPTPPKGDEPGHGEDGPVAPPVAFPPAPQVALSADQPRDAQGRWTTEGAAEASDKGEAAGRSGGQGAATAGKASADARSLSNAAASTGSASMHRAAEAQHGTAAALHRAAAARTQDPVAKAAHGNAAVAHAMAATAHAEQAKQIDQARVDRARGVLDGKSHVSQIGGSFAGGDDAQSRVHWAATKAAQTGKPVFISVMKPGEEKHTSEGAMKLGYKAPAKGDFHVVHPDGSITHHAAPAKAGKGAAVLHEQDADGRIWLDSAEDETRDADGRWTSGGGGAEPAAQDEKKGLSARVGGLLSKAAGKALAGIKAAPGAVKGIVMHEVQQVKDAGLGIKAAIQGKPVTPEQKKAIKTLAIKVATKVAFSAVGGALPGVGHAVGAALEHLPHAVEAVAHYVGHHAAEHAVERLAKHAFHASAEHDGDFTESDAAWFVGEVCDGVKQALADMSGNDWHALLGPHLSPGAVKAEREREDAELNPPADVMARLRSAFQQYFAPAARVGSVLFYSGIQVRIDRPVGSVQTGVDAHGKPWSRTFTVPYGEIVGTEGGDDEPLDVFCGPDPDAPTAYWVTQKKADGGFDEFKVGLGWPDQGSLIAAYLAHVPAQYLGEVRVMLVAQMQALLGIDPQVEATRALALVVLEFDPGQPRHTGGQWHSGASAFADARASEVHEKASEATGLALRASEAASTAKTRAAHAAAQDAHRTAQRAHQDAATQHAFLAREMEARGQHGTPMHDRVRAEERRHAAAAWEHGRLAKRESKLAAAAGGVQAQREGAPPQLALAFNPDQPRGPDGRWGGDGGGAEAKQIAGAISQKMKDSPGGFSWSHTEGTPTTGYMVARDAAEGHGATIPLAGAKRSEVTAAVTAWVKRELPFMKEHPDHFWGGWAGMLDGRPHFFLDVSQRVPDRDAAIAAGKDRNQIAIWHLDSSTEIPTGGTGK